MGRCPAGRLGVVDVTVQAGGWPSGLVGSGAWPGVVEEGRRVCGQLSPACRCAIKVMVGCGIVRALPEEKGCWQVMETCSSKRLRPTPGCS